MNGFRAVLTLALFAPTAAIACPISDGLVTCNGYYDISSDQYGNEQNTYPTCDPTGVYSGAEVNFDFRPAAGTRVDLIAESPSPVDIDMFLTRNTCGGSCAGSSTNAGSAHEQISFVADGGSYVINVDEDNGSLNYSGDLRIGCETTCSQSDVADAITCSTDLSADTTGGTLALDYYACGTPLPNWIQTGAEDIYTFQAQRAGPVTLRLDGFAANRDQDVYVLEAACDPDACVASDDSVNATNAVTFNAKANTTYYVVVEANAGMGPYHLAFDVGAGGCLEDCDDGIDNDGDGAGDCADSNCTGDPACACNPVWSYQDADGDGYGDAAGDAFATCGWSAPAGFAPNSTDCNDDDASISPGATEVCNGHDDDCDVDVDEGVTALYYPDADHDGSGDPYGTVIEGCVAPEGYVANNADCDDTNAAVNPDQPEICDGIDNDCNGLIDENASDPSIPEICNGVDDNCDGVVDEGTECTDDDGDCACDGPAETCAYSVSEACTTRIGGDCNDGDPTVAPGIPEVVDGKDQDCDGLIDEGTSAYDDDGDGYTEDFGDCDDSNPLVNVGATEIPGNGVDDDCDGQIDETAPIDTDTDGDTDIPVIPGEVKGCSCGSAPSPAGTGALALLLIAARRRRNVSR